METVRPTALKSGGGSLLSDLSLLLRPRRRDITPEDLCSPPLRHMPNPTGPGHPQMSIWPRWDAQRAPPSHIQGSIWNLGPGLPPPPATWNSPLFSRNGGACRVLRGRTRNLKLNSGEVPRGPRPGQSPRPLGASGSAPTTRRGTGKDSLCKQAFRPWFILFP